MQFRIRMELTHILMIQLSIRKLERDFKTENQLLEADKERRVTKRSSSLLLMIRMRSLIDWHERTKIYSKKMQDFPVKTKFLSNRFHTSKKHLLIPALLEASNNLRCHHHRKFKVLSDKKILTNSSLKSSIRSTGDSSMKILSLESHSILKSILSKVHSKVTMICFSIVQLPENLLSNWWLKNTLIMPKWERTKEQDWTVGKLAPILPTSLKKLTWKISLSWREIPKTQSTVKDISSLLLFSVWCAALHTFKTTPTQSNKEMVDSRFHFQSNHKLLEAETLNQPSHLLQKSKQD